ncbi:MAG: 2-C-methyl-D-erythritol 2,4-cyclodiphosphate synthase [Clostridia bacterium]|nr:2-C-methyl-D-erythritol 2,4-cyclodiphosphate synthase [Clostridia bacterium]
MRIGHGYDVHRFTEGNYVIIGGVKIPFNKSLLAHSDGDVLVHAIADAILGAAAERDIGYHFPDNDDSYKNVNSLCLLSIVNQIITKKGYVVENIDSTIIAQAPKMMPYILDMKKNIANTLGIDEDCVNVKATTEEKLGFTGRGEGISAHCVCLLTNKGKTL